MEFKFIIKKWANFYFFISNLSEWHFSCIREYNDEWLKELGPLNKNQKMALEKFKEIHQKYSFGNNFLGSHFYLKKNPWGTLKEAVSKQEFKSIQEIFFLFKQKFNLFYKKELTQLKSWKFLLEKNLKSHLKAKSITKILNTLYGTKASTKKFIIYLLPSGKDITSGSGNIGDNKSMAIAISHQPLKNCNRTIAVIWHETIHRFFEKEYFLPMVKSKFPEDQDAVNLIKEATVSSLFPNGLLGRKFFKMKSDSLNRKLPNAYNKPILKLTKYYIEKNKAFDETYVDKLYRIILKLKGILK